MPTFSPQYNQTFAQQTFTIQNNIGDSPITQSYLLEPITEGSATTTYDNFVLVGYSNANSNAVGIYNSSSGNPNYGIFAGFLFSDEVDYVNASVNGASAVPVAVSSPAGSAFPYAVFKGFNSGTTDIDALITAGKAIIRYININGVTTKYVVFPQTIGSSNTNTY